MPGAPNAAGPYAPQDTYSEVQNLTDLLDILTHQAQSELGNTAGSIFFFGDGLQRALTDGFFDLFSPKTWTPANILRLSSQTVQQTIQLSRLLSPGQANLAWQELRNKLEVFTNVRNLSANLKLPPGKFIPLAELVDKAYSLSPFLALWAVEGLGHDYTDRYWENKGIPNGLLSEEQAPVPAKSLLMLHAGMGLSFADRLLGRLNPDDPSASLTHATVEQFVSLCRNNCRKGYLGAAIESLGLQTRVFYPDLLNVMHQQLQRVAPELTGFFWHGAGRALYFSREYFLPGLTTVWSGIDEEARSCPDRESAMAGLAWALTLVNMRQPAIVEHALRSYTQDASLARGFANGVASSIIMRQDTTPDEPFISAFYQHRPDPSVLQSVEMWTRFILAPTQLALQKYYPVLKQHDALDQVFRYQDLAALVGSLQNQGAVAQIAS